MSGSQLQPELGHVIRRLRGERDFSSRAHLADEARVSVGVVERLEAGKVVRTQNLASVAAALNTTVGELNKQALQERFRNGAGILPGAGQRQAIVFGLAYEELKSFFEAIDHEISETFGRLYSPTQKSQTDFSSRKLFSSLSIIGIPPEIILEIIATLPPKLRDTKNEKEFSTSHIRQAVAEAINSIPAEAVLKSELGHLSTAYDTNQAIGPSADDRKFEWVKKYCRRYGDPNQTIKMIEIDGTLVSIDFNYLKTVVVPHMLKRLLGEDFILKDSSMVSATSIVRRQGFRDS